MLLFLQLTIKFDIELGDHIVELLLSLSYTRILADETCDRIPIANVTLIQIMFTNID